MGKIHETKVTLRFRGDDLDPEELTKRLGASPTSAAARGATLRSAGGRERVARTGQWHLSIDPATPGEEFESQITRLFDQLTSNEGTWRELSEQFGGNLFVGLFLGGSNEGVVVGPETLRAIAVRGLELGLDIYGPSDE